MLYLCNVATLIFTHSVDRLTRSEGFAVTVPPNLPQDREHDYAEVIDALDVEFRAACVMFERDGFLDRPETATAYLEILDEVLTGVLPERVGAQRIIDLMLADA